MSIIVDMVFPIVVVAVVIVVVVVVPMPGQNDHELISAAYTSNNLDGDLRSLLVRTTFMSPSKLEV